ncbi:MAG: hypothetical protein NTZ74_14595 [Chloroflexi bacterium]|nr:hypothetical protein [Chloroflexota bacterium]
MRIEQHSTSDLLPIVQRRRSRWDGVLATSEPVISVDIASTLSFPVENRSLTCSFSTVTAISSNYKPKAIAAAGRLKSVK